MTIDILPQHRRLVITPDPGRDAVRRSAHVLGNQFLHVYQLLYVRGLTHPGTAARPLRVERVITHGTVTTALAIIAVDQPDLRFTVHAGDDDQETLRRVALVLDAVGKEKISPRACCAMAERRCCVCLESFTCPLHGTTCIGSHD